MAKELVHAQFKNPGRYDIKADGFGHHIVIVPGATAHVPAELHGDVMRQGAKPLYEKEVQLEGRKPVNKAVEETDLTKRNLSLQDVLRSMVAENNITEWGANGKPKVRVVCDKMGYKVTAAEIAEAWSSVRPEV